MGKLHDTVKFKNYLVDQIDHLDLKKSIEDKFDVLKKTKRIVPLVDQIDHLGLKKPIEEKIEFLEKTKRIFPRHIDYCDRIIKDYLLLEQQSQSAVNSILEQISRLDSEIDDMSVAMFNNNEYHSNFHEERIQGPEFKNNLILSTELESAIISKITEYSDWHYPALQINPRSKQWIDSMVAADPLYLTHCYINLVKEIIKPYPNLYQNRLRLYEIVDRNFSKLPQAQFSFVLCWDYFNYLSSIFVEKYIREVYHLLRPGGRFMFSYTNCDLAGSALRVESLACAYASSRWIKKLCNEIGYEISDLKDFDTGDAFNTHVSWAILKKPGILNTVKAAQAMAEIKYK
jgi:hypothetical protein